jgi:hypothetical protein
MTHANIPTPAEHTDHDVTEIIGDQAVAFPPLPVAVASLPPVELRAAPAFTATTIPVPLIGSASQRVAPNEPTRRRLLLSNLGPNPIVIADTDGSASAGLGYTLASGAQLVMLTTADVYAAATTGASSCAVLSELAPW